MRSEKWEVRSIIIVYNYFDATFNKVNSSEIL